MEGRGRGSWIEKPRKLARKTRKRDGKYRLDEKKKENLQGNRGTDCSQSRGGKGNLSTQANRPLNTIWNRKGERKKLRHARRKREGYQAGLGASAKDQRGHRKG